MNFIVRMLTLSTLIVITGCASMKPLPPWSKQQVMLKRLNTWSLVSKISVQSERSSDFFTTVWHQNGYRYRLRMYAPFDLRSLYITGRPGHVGLWQRGKEVSAARSPETLMAQRLGWSLPVSKLRYWIRGLPAPGRRAHSIYNGEHRLLAFQQAGWQVHYLNFHRYRDFALPRKFTLENKDFRVKVVVKRWSNLHLY